MRRYVRVAFKRERLLPRDHGGSDCAGERAEGYAGAGFGSLLVPACSPILRGMPAEVERLASEVIELSTRRILLRAGCLGGVVLSGWARSASGDTAEGISWIEDGIRRLSGNRRDPCDCHIFLALKAEALHLAHRTSDALEAINEAGSTGRKIWRTLLVCRTAPAPRCVSHGSRRREDGN